MQFHRIERCRDKNFWSVRAGRDIRIIVHKSDASLLLCFVDHHDKAYQWAEKRRLEPHPRTGAAQLVEIRETVREIEVPAIADKDKLVSLSAQFLLDEWNDVVDGWNLTDWPEYRDFKRLGRKTRLREADRKQVWGVFERLREELSRQNTRTMAMVYYSLAESTACPFQAVIVDECQDMSPAQLRFLCRVSEKNPGELFFAGDLGQRIFQTPFSWTSLGVDIRGRSRTLKVNYRTSHQIRKSADRLLDGAVSDVDGNEEHRDGTVSVFNGPPPAVYVADDEDAESDHVAEWLLARVNENIEPAEIAIFGRTESQLARARDAIRKASDITGRGLGGIRLLARDQRVETDCRWTHRTVFLCSPRRCTRVKYDSKERFQTLASYPTVPLVKCS